MHFAFTEEQQELRRTARSFLDRWSSPARVRAAMETDAGFDPEVWGRIGAELGFTSLVVPEAYGGAGLGCVELVALMEEMGRALFCGPFFSTVCLAAAALVAGGSEAQKQEHLPAIAAGELQATVAVTEANGRWDASGIETVARRDGGEVVLRGAKTYVPDGHTAALLIVAARAEGSAGEDGIGLYLVPAGAGGLSRRLLPTMDQTRRQAAIELRDVRVPAEARLGAEGDGARILRATLDRAAVALSAEQVGGAERCLAMAVDYAKVRVQFGRAIGSFQAIKHKCADMLLRVESARSASYHAGWVADHARADLPVAAAMAKAYCSEAFFHCAAENLQIHGGVGFTWEHDAHLYFKRAQSAEGLLGSPSFHRERVAAHLLG